MQTITLDEWTKYRDLLKKLSETAADEFRDAVWKKGGRWNGAGLGGIPRDDLIDYAYALVTKYGEGSAALAAEMYDEMAALSGAKVPPAIPAETASIDDVGKALNGAIKVSDNEEYVSSVVNRLVKQAGQDTTLQNAKRDGAQFAWVPAGETCAFCLTLASNGWQYASKDSIKNGHAEHIHANCDCAYAVRFDNNTEYKGYDPDKYKKMYYGAEGNTPNEKINSLRKRLSDNEGPFRTVDERRNEERKSIIKPHNVIKNLESTQVGNEALSLIKENDVNVDFVYGRDNVINGQPLLGYFDLADNSITIFADKTQNVKDTAKIVVHEAFHLDDYGPCQKSEVLCMEKELMHEKNTTKLTQDEINGIINQVREMYSDLPWEC